MGHQSDIIIVTELTGFHYLVLARHLHASPAWLREQRAKSVDFSIRKTHFHFEVTFRALPHPFHLSDQRLHTFTARTQHAFALSPGLLASSDPHSRKAPLLSSRSALMCRVGASPASERAYSCATTAGATSASNSNMAMNTPVRLFPVVQWMKMAGGDFVPVADSSRCISMVRNIGAPALRISTNAVTTPYKA